MHNIVMCMNQSDSIVIIPTYNEKENVENIIRAVFALEKCFHILLLFLSFGLCFNYSAKINAIFQHAKDFTYTKNIQGLFFGVCIVDY